MITDYSEELSRTAGPPATAKQSIVGVAGVAIIGGRVRKRGIAIDWATGETQHPYVRTVDALVGATGGVRVDVVAADDEALVSNPVVLSTITIPAASFVANKLHPMSGLMAGSPRKCLGAKFTPITTNSTAGSLICGFGKETGRPQNNVNAI